MSFLDVRDTRAFSRASKHDNRTALQEMRNRFSDANRKAIQSAVKVIEKIEQATKDPEAIAKLTLAKQKLASINSISLDNSNWDNLKTSIVDVRDHIERVFTSLGSVKLEPPHVNVFQLWSNINTGDILDAEEKKSIVPVISEFANLFDMLPNERKREFLNNLMTDTIPEELINYISLFNKLPVSEENDNVREHFLATVFGDDSKIKGEWLNIVLNQVVSKLCDENVQNHAKSQIAGLFASFGSIDDALKIINTFPAEKSLLVQTYTYKDGDLVPNPVKKDIGLCRDNAFYLCLIGALMNDKTENFSKLYNLFPAGEIKDYANKAILTTLLDTKTLELDENIPVTKETISALLEQKNVITNQEFRKKVGHLLSKRLWD